VPGDRGPHRQAVKQKRRSIVQRLSPSRMTRIRWGGRA
jgi:hypothetical protein